MVEADSGAIGGKDSHEFIALADAGEDTIVLCESCDYAANVERAVFTKPENTMEEPLPIQEVTTPGIKTIKGQNIICVISNIERKHFVIRRNNFFKF